MYRGVLRSNGKPVAVKVQRPGVRESIALDIFILRYLAGRHSLSALATFHRNTDHVSSAMHAHVRLGSAGTGTMACQ